MDFSEIKHALKDVADSLDHRVLLPGKNPHISIRKEGEEVEARYQGKRYLFPDDDVIILELKSITAEILSEYIVAEFLKRVTVPKNIIQITAGIDEGPGQGAWSSIDIVESQLYNFWLIVREFAYSKLWGKIFLRNNY